MYPISTNLYSTNLWNIIKDQYHQEQSITDGSNFMIGNGYLGYRGTFAEDRKDGYVGCFVTDTWDKADDKWEELCNAPNALFLDVSYCNKVVDFTSNIVSFKRELDTKHAVSKRDVTIDLDENTQLQVQEEKFASYANKHLIGMKYTLTSNQSITLQATSGIDTDLWDINGTHLINHELIYDKDYRGVQSTTFLYNDSIVVLEKTEGISTSKDFITNETIHLQSNLPYTIYKYMVVVSSNDVDDPHLFASNIIQNLSSYEEEYKHHCNEWDTLWNHFDVKVTGDPVAQVGYRFNTYHAIIATPVHKSLPIGARGLSCQAYQGSAFWDQEVFNLPMYLFTYPEIAKGILTYRYNTLDGARRKAKKHGYEGAFYAWISGKTGDELCPDFFFKDVITDRKIRNHFNLWQIHISPDIAYTIRKYHQSTNDDAFMYEMGLEMMMEICRFLASRVDYKPRRDRYEIIRVQGPDEYHENVDNNAFTNWQAHFAFKWTLDYMSTLDSTIIDQVKKKISLQSEEIKLWRDILSKLYLVHPNEEGVIEQFDDFFKLESIVPATDVTSRLIDPEEYYGWPNGIAVFTQCLKQSDTIQLLHMHPHLFDQETITANYEYYEPRTLHFSSLSPSIHSVLACRIKDEVRARKYFDKAVSVDLMNTNEAVSGGTFIGGMHTAANAAVWQMMVYGFAGFSLENGVIYFDPFLLPEFNNLSFRLVILSQELSVTITKTTIEITNHSRSKELTLSIQNKQFQLIDSLTISYKE